MVDILGFYAFKAIIYIVIYLAVYVLTLILDRRLEKSKVRIDKILLLIGSLCWLGSLVMALSAVAELVGIGFYFLIKG